jgi:hypothetical protein
MSLNEHYREVSCRYFRGAGKQNTRAVLGVVAQRVKELAIRKILIASCGGETVFKALDILDGQAKIIAVSHVTGFLEPNVQELSDENRKKLEAAGVTIFTGQHAFGGVGRGVRRKLATYQVDEIMAFTLRIFGQGVKVAVEIALMAADAGFVRTDEDIISIGGTAEGADAALIIQPANSSSIFDMKVREIICKPFTF